jgi:hypothetical protein
VTPTSLPDRFAHAVREGTDRAGDDLLPSVLATACARVLPHDAAGISLMSGRIARVPLGASDEDAATAERLQFTHGDGPCFRAMGEGRPVTVTEESWRTSWPALAESHFARTPFRSGLSVPLRVGAERIGVLDLYGRGSEGPSGNDIIDGQVVAALVTSMLLDAGPRTAGRPPEDRPEDAAVAWRSGPAALRRHQVWIAVGMTNLALQLSSSDALAVLRARAYADGRTLDDLADDLVAGRVGVDSLRESQVR